MRRFAGKSGYFSAVLLSLALGCRSEPDTPRDPKSSRAGQAPAVASAEPDEESRAPAEVERYELLRNLDACDVEHDGLLLDLGTPSIDARRRFAVVAAANTAIDREGSSFERISSVNQVFDVWLDEPIEKPMLSLRVHGGAARTVHLGVDDVRFGALRLPGGETRVISSSAGSAPLARGRHRIALRFAGAARGNKSPLAEVDWLRLSEVDLDPSRYAAPTARDIVDDVALERVPKRSLVLRAPSYVRCWLRPQSDTRLKVAVGLLGAGKGVAELRLLRDGEPPVVLQTRRITGGDGATWTPVGVDLGSYAGAAVGLELAALEATRGSRVAFGDPTIVRRDEPALAQPRARLAIVVVLAAVDRARLPPWGPTGNLRVLGELARGSAAFSSYRVPSSVPAAVVASLLSGLSPRAHGLEDPSSRLIPEIRLLPEAVKEAGGRTAMFTSAPTTFAPFGFNQGWDLFETYSPVRDLPAVEPLTRATRWVEQAIDGAGTSPVLAWVHARGSHPPWDLSREEAQQLKPSDYAGVVDPRRGGVILGALRARRGKGKRLLDADWARIRSLSVAALERQDAALGQLIAMLKRRGVWDETLLVVTSDVAPGEPPEFPFDPRGALTEDRLQVPLLVKFPARTLEGKELQFATTSSDVAITIARVLGLHGVAAGTGFDLAARGLGREPVLSPPQVASLPGRYATRSGRWLLRGAPSQVPSLCAVDVDPACVSDVFDRELVAARTLWQLTFQELSRAAVLAPPDAQRRVGILDEETAAGLTVWGD